MEEHIGEFISALITYGLPTIFTIINLVLWYKLKKSKAKVDILKVEAETKGTEAHTEQTSLETLAITVNIYKEELIIFQERLQTAETEVLNLKADFKFMVEGVEILIAQVKRLDPCAIPDFTIPDCLHT